MKVDKQTNKKSAEAEAAIKAAAEILEPFKEQIAKEDLEGLVEIEKTDDGDEDDTAPPAKAPQKKKTSKAKPADNSDDGEQDNEDPKMATKKKVSKTADDELDLSEVPDAVRPHVESIYKANRDLIAKSEKLEKDLADERRTRREKEFIAKCEGFKHYSGDKKELATELMELSDASPKLYDKIVKQLEAVEAEKAAAAGLIFSELGSSVPGNTGVGSFEAIEKAAEAVVAKSGEKVSKEQAVEKFLSTPEGKSMYSQYKASRKDGV